MTITRTTLWTLVAGVGLVTALTAALGRVPNSVPPPPTPSSNDTLGALPADQWLNATTPPSAAALRGQVVLLEFWTFLCYNCRNVQPWMREVHSRYRHDGLQVLGIHSPEFAQERDVGSVRRYASQNGIVWPIGIDDRFEVWRRYNTTNAWPAFFVYDRRGRLVYRGAGENAVTGAEAAIVNALADTTGKGAVGVDARLRRVGDSLEVALVPAAGFKLVRRPANEVWVDGVSDHPVLQLGDPGPAEGEVEYFHGPAVARIQWPSGGIGRGHLVFRYCSDVDRVCLRRTLDFGPEDIGT